MLNLARNIIKQKSKVLLMASLTRSPTRRSTCSPSRRSTMSPTRRPTRRFTRRPAQFLPRIFLPQDLHLKLAKSWNFILNSQKLFLHFQETLDDVLIGRNYEMQVRRKDCFWCHWGFETHLFERVSLKNTLLLSHRLRIVQLLLRQGFRLWGISGSCFRNR